MPERVVCIYSPIGSCVAAYRALLSNRVLVMLFMECIITGYIPQRAYNLVSSTPKSSNNGQLGRRYITP